MRIEIDDALINEAMEMTGLPNKEAVLEAALRHFTTHHARKKTLAELRGMGWSGDLDEMRRDIGLEKDNHQLPTFETMAAQFRAVTAGREHTPSEILLQEERDRHAY